MNDKLKLKLTEDILDCKDYCLWAICLKSKDIWEKLRFQRKYDAKEESVIIPKDLYNELYDFLCDTKGNDAYITKLNKSMLEDKWTKMVYAQELLQIKE